MEIRTRDTAETAALGACLGRVLRHGAWTRLLLELRGDLGAGKTVFVRGLSVGLCVAANARVVSPTYTIARSYPISGGPLRFLHHLDAYRLEGPDDLEAIGIEEMCGEGCVTCVEWGENVAEALPEDRIRMLLEAQPPENLEPGAAPECPRFLAVEALGPRAAEVLDAWRRAWHDASHDASPDASPDARVPDACVPDTCVPDTDTLAGGSVGGEACAAEGGV